MNNFLMGQPLASNGPVNLNHERKIVSLHNPSNYCFANVVLQVLFNIKEFRQYFVNGLLSNHVAPSRRPVFTAIVNEVLRKLADPRNDCISLQKLLRTLGPEYLIGYIHHDSSEFLLRLLDELDNELSMFPKAPLTFRGSPANPLRVAVEKTWNQFCDKTGASIVKFLFYGNECSTVSCLNCSAVSYSTEPSMLFSLALPQKVIEVFFVPKKVSSQIQYLHLAAETSDKWVTVETVVMQISLLYKVPPSKLTATHWKGDLGGLAVLNLSSRICPDLPFIVFETDPFSIYFSLTLKVNSSVIKPVVKKCSYCYKASASVKQCTLCHRVAYCNKTCQTADWSRRHKSACEILKNRIEEAAEDFGFPLLIPINITQQQLDYCLLEATCLRHARRFLDLEVSDHNCAANGDDSFLEECEEVFQDVRCSSTDFKNISNDQNHHQVTSCASPEGVDDFDSSGRTKMPHNRSICESVVHSPSFSSGNLSSHGVQFSLLAQMASSSLDENHHNEQDSGSDSEFSDSVELCLNQQRDWSTFMKYLQSENNNCHLVMFFSKKPENCGSVTNGITHSPEGAKLVHTDNWNINLIFDNQSGDPVVYDCKRVTLDQCLISHFAPLSITDRNCDDCKQKCDSIKCSHIWNLPHYLFVHFKRAAQVQSWTKVLTAVEFPVEDLDLSPYVAHGHPAALSFDYKHKYKLHSVIQHHGRFQVKGHYTCYIRLPSGDTNSDSSCDSVRAQDCQWYHFDDETISPVSISSLQQAEPFLLVYENVSSSAKAHVKHVMQNLSCYS